MKIRLRLLAILALFALITLAGRAPLHFLFVVSGSMEPVMPTGSLIVVRSGDNHNFETGQIITFQQDGILITHRIIQTGNDGAFYCITKGDANLNPDTSFIRREEIIGRVIFITPPFMAPALRTIRGISVSSSSCHNTAKGRNAWLTGFAPTAKTACFVPVSSIN